MFVQVQTCTCTSTLSGNAPHAYASRSRFTLIRSEMKSTVRVAAVIQILYVRIAEHRDLGLKTVTDLGRGKGGENASPF